MAKRLNKRAALFCALVLAVTLFCPPVRAQGQDTVYLISLEGEINPSLVSSMKLAFADASRAKAKLIILEIDTYGGRVDSSDSIKTLIYDSAIPVHAYVKKAISGGTYAALACDRIYMHPGATLGAVEPVTSDGQPVTDEKTLSVIEGQLRAMAERHGRDPSIASAMVRKEVAVPDLVEAGKILTLTAKTALAVGYSEGTVSGYEEIPALSGITSPDFHRFVESWSLKLAATLTNPVVAALLLTVGLSALIIELLTPGFGVPGSIALVAFALYFGGHIFIGFARSEYLILFALGLVLLAAEIFTAGFGILGASGLLCIGGSLVLSAPSLTMGLVTLAVSLAASVVVLLVAFRFLRKSPLWNKLVLQDNETKERGYVGPRDLRGYIGAQGVALTPLKPGGSVQVGEDRLDALSQGPYLTAGTEVVVTGVSSGSVIVSEK